MSRIFNRLEQTPKRQKLRGESPACERMLWAQLRGEACGVRFRRQVSVGPFVLDFYCPQLRLAIEIDGPSHETDDAIAYDAARQQQIEIVGVQFLRFTNEQVYRHMPAVMDTILQTVQRLKAESGGQRDPLCPPGISPSTKGRNSGAPHTDRSPKDQS